MLPTCTVITLLVSWSGLMSICYSFRYLLVALTKEKSSRNLSRFSEWYFFKVSLSQMCRMGSWADVQLIVRYSGSGKSLWDTKSNSLDSTMISTIPRGSQDPAFTSIFSWFSSTLSLTLSLSSAFRSYSSITVIETLDHPPRFKFSINLMGMINRLTILGKLSLTSFICFYWRES